MTVGRQAVGEVGAGAVVFAGAAEQVVLLAPVGAGLMGGTDYGGFGDQGGGGERPHSNLSAGEGGVVGKGVMGDMEDGLDGLFFMTSKDLRGEA